MKLKDMTKYDLVRISEQLTRDISEVRENLRMSLWLTAAFFLYGVIITACYVMGVK